MPLDTWQIGCVMNAVAGHFLQTWLFITHPGISVRQFKEMSIAGDAIASEFEEVVRKAITERIPRYDYKALRKVTG